MPDQRPKSPNGYVYLPPMLDELYERDNRALKKWVEGYTDIQERAAEGKAITAQDFEKLDAELNETFKETQRKLPQALNLTVEKQLKGRPMMNSVAPTLSAHKQQRSTFREFQQRRNKILDAYTYKHNEMLEMWLDHPDIVNQRDNISGLVSTLHKQQVLRSPHRKNIEFEKLPNDGGELLLEVLKRNRGAVVTDQHTSAVPLRYLIEHAGDLKKAGVDTVYMEFEATHFAELSALSLAELKQLASTRSYGNTVLASPKEIAQRYNKFHSDDVALESINMMIALREKGIRLVNIDKENPARDMEARTSIDHRVASTNFTWPAKIEADRAKLEKMTGKKDGKFIVFGGPLHFLEYGLVDEVLGVPVIAFTREGETPIAAVAREYNKFGPDFYLNGGKNYMDTRKMVYAANMDAAAGLLKKFDSIPGVQSVREVMQKAAEQYRFEVSSETDFAHKDTKVPVLPKQAGVKKSLQK